MLHDQENNQVTRPVKVEQKLEKLTGLADAVPDKFKKTKKIIPGATC